MCSKSFILSASGLKNIVLNSDAYCKNEEEDNLFHFILGAKDLKMSFALADFISPRVSRLHAADPTANAIDFTEVIRKMPNTEAIFTEDVLNVFLQLSRGEAADVCADASRGLRLLAVLLGNREIYDRLGDLHPISDCGASVAQCVQCLQCLDCCRSFDSGLDALGGSFFADFISRHFYLADHASLFCLSKSAIHAILSSENLRLRDEDSLLDFVNQLFEEEKSDDSDELNKTAFYELIDFSELSDQKLRSFIDTFNPSDLSAVLWQKIAAVMTAKISGGCENKNCNSKNPGRYVK